MSSPTEHDDSSDSGTLQNTSLENAMTSLDNLMTLRDNAITARDNAMTSRDNAMTSLDNAMTARDNVMTARDNVMTSRDNAMTSRDNAMTSQNYVVISDDDSSESLNTAALQTTKRARLTSEDQDVVMLPSSPDNDRSVVMVTSDNQPGPSGVSMVTSRPTSELMTSLTRGVSMVTSRPTSPISVMDDDEPVITNVIDRETPEPLTWQLVRSLGPEDLSVRRNGYAVSRYRHRRPTARRAIRARQYNDFVNIVRDLTHERVIVSPLSRSSEPRRSSRLYSRTQSDIYNRASHLAESSHAMSSTSDDGLNIERGDVISHRRPLVAHEEILHMSSLRNRITTLRRDLQNLNGLLTNSFDLLSRIAPVPSAARIDKTVLDRAPTKVVTKADVENEKTCSICLAPYKEGETLRLLPCDHYFHDICIDRWLTTCSRMCPFCRTDIQEALSRGHQVT